jgi:hypothetical protein
MLTSARSVLAGLALLLAAAALAQPASTPGRDGSHDFDFAHGRWKVKVRKLKTPLKGSDEWVEMTGTSVCRPFWSGAGNLDEFDVDGPSGHIEAITLRMYSASAGQWSLNWSTRKAATFGVPTVGEFRNGRGEFYDQEVWEGRTIFVRYVWSGITTPSAHFEQAFSDDGGKTWEVNWISDQTRIE